MKDPNYDPDDNLATKVIVTGMSVAIVIFFLMCFVIMLLVGTFR